MRVLLTGANGMVGRELHDRLRSDGIDTVAVGREELDITRETDVDYLLQNVRPDVLMNCAAYTAVDECESNRDQAFLVNGEAVSFLAEHSNRWNTLLIQFSTDFVFDGSKRSPYEVGDQVNPLSAYGESKLAGERSAARAQRHLIIRTSWLFGSHGKNFVESITNQIEKGREQLRVVDDQRGRPTYVPHLVDATMRLLEKAKTDDEARGVVHYADLPFSTWYELSLEIINELRSRGISAEAEIEPIATEEMPRPAERPSYSVLSTSRYEEITGTSPDLWQLGLSDYFDRR